VHSAHLLAWAFPALTELNLYQVELGDGALFSMLAAQATCLLSSITLSDCDIKDTAVEMAATALARLPSLKACHVDPGRTVPLRIASELTSLTSLRGALDRRPGVHPVETQLVKAVSRNTGLQSLTVSFTPLKTLSAGVLQCLLQRGTSLTQIDLTSVSAHQWCGARHLAGAWRQHHRCQAELVGADQELGRQHMQVAAAAACPHGGSSSCTSLPATRISSGAGDRRSWWDPAPTTTHSPRHPSWSRLCSRQPPT
jgi:hypothetical protein